MDLQVRMLGPFDIISRGTSRPIGGPRERRLLAALLLNCNNTVPIERLIDVLWDTPPSSARQQVFNIVGDVRRHLEAIDGISLTTDQVGYRADIDVGALDLATFRAAVRRARQLTNAGDLATAVAELSAACRLWRGPALAGLDRTHFDHIGARLEEERLEAIDSLMALRIELGECAHVVGELRELVATQPYREATRVNLMAALYGSGRQAEALGVYDEARRLLRDEFGLDPGDGLRRIHETVLHGEPVAATAHPASAHPAVPAHPAADAVEPALHDPQLLNFNPPPLAAVPKRKFLPRDSPDFAGRRDELEHLLAEPDRDARRSLTIFTIDGMGGVGKTALAVHAAHAVAPAYPDGQFFVDLRGFTIGMVPLTPAEALSLLLRQAGTPEELIPADVESRSAAWRAQMADKEAVLLLDNAVDAAQVRPLLPGTGGALVLVTSRRRLPSLEGARSLSLGPLPRDDAMTLFTRIVGANRVREAAPDAAGDAASVVGEDLVRVVELCGRLPLAIRIAAARFRDRGTWTIPFLVTLLSDHKARSRFLDIGERSVSAVLHLSYRYLTAEQRRVFRLLGLHAGRSFSPAVAAALADVPLDQAADILEVLFDDNLVVQAEPGRYFLHDLVRDCAHSLCLRHDPEEARRAALRRLVAYHVHWASAVCGQLGKGPFRFVPDLENGEPGRHRGLKSALEDALKDVPKDTRSALEILKREGPDLVATATLAFAEGLDREAWQLTCAIQPYLSRGNYPEPSMDLFAKAVRACRALGADLGEALSLTGLALAQRERRQIAEAETSLQAAIAISRRTADQAGELYQLTELGVTAESREAFAEAHRHFASALAIAEELGDRRRIAVLRTNLGAVCRHLGLDAEASANLDHALAAHRALDRSSFDRSTFDHPGSEASALVHLGLLLLRRDDPVAAGRHLTEAVAAAAVGGHTLTEATAHAALCVMHRMTGNLAPAFDHGRTALRSSREHHFLDVECDALNALGEAHLALRDDADADAGANTDADAKAETTFRLAADLSAERSLHSCRARALEGLAHLALYQDSIAEARELFQAALAEYPLGVADAESVRFHLADLTDAGRTCQRCRAAPGPRRRTAQALVVTGTFAES